MRKWFGASLAALAVLMGLGTGTAHAAPQPVAPAAHTEMSLSDLKPKAAPPKIGTPGFGKPMKGIKAHKAAPVDQGKVTALRTGCATAPTSPCYFYVGGSQTVTNTGVYANMMINWSFTDRIPSDNLAHNVTELDVETKRANNNRDIVEVGTWSDKDVHGNDDPYFFVSHWVNGVFQGYNAGFVPYTGSGACTYHPGDSMGAINGAVTGAAVKVGVEYRNDTGIQKGWWVSEGAAWCGVIPADPAATSLTNNRWYGSGANFTSAAKFQAFGEVTSQYNEPCTDMGNGILGSSFVTPWSYSSDPSYIASLALTGTTTTANIGTGYRVPSVSVYDLNVASGRTFYYGGPGYNSAGTGIGTGGTC